MINKYNFIFYLLIMWILYLLSIKMIINIINNQYVYKYIL